MRAAYVCADAGVPVFGHKGCSVHVQEMLRGLKSRGIDIDLFATRLGGEPSAELAGVRVHKIPVSSSSNRVEKEQSLLGANGPLTELLKCEGPFDLVYERYSLFSHAAMQYARKSGTPGLLEVNSPLIEEQSQHRHLVDRESAEQTSDQAFGSATALLAVSDEVARYLERRPSASGRVSVVSNGVDPERFVPHVRSLSAKNHDTFRIGFVGSLKPWHGLPNLLEAFAKLHQREPTARLIIVGKGPQREEIEQDLEGRSEALRRSVELKGAIPPSEIPAMLASFDVAVAPYPQIDDFYFSPLKVYEYMAAGLPVVASRVGELSRLIRHGVDGILCQPGDSDALAVAFEELHGQPLLRRQLGEAARQSVDENHTWSARISGILALAKVGTFAESCSSEGGP